MLWNLIHLKEFLLGSFQNIYQILKGREKATVEKTKVKFRNLSGCIKIPRGLNAF